MHTVVVGPMSFASCLPTRLSTWMFWSCSLDIMTFWGMTWFVLVSAGFSNSNKFQYLMQAGYEQVERVRDVNMAY